MKIKFVTENFDSYTDFRRMIDLAGFERVTVDQIVDDGSVYIVSPMTERIGHRHIEISNPMTPTGTRSKFIYWMLERPALDPKKFLTYWDYLFSEIWVHDAVFMSTGYPKLRLVRLGSDARLKTKDGYEPYILAGERNRFDFIHLCAPLGRRWHILNHLAGNTAPNGWGADRNANLRCSKFMLNVHQDDYFYMEPLRIALAAAYQLPLLTEELYPGNLRSGFVVQQHYDDLLDTAASWVLQKKAPIEASRLFEKYCVDETFEKNIRKALA